MNTFESDILNFQKNGTYEYKFDAVGNAIFNLTSTEFQKTYFAIPVNSITYNSDHINTYYSLEFEEFKPLSSPLPNTSSELQSELELKNKENESLKAQLNKLLEDTQINSPKNVDVATKQVILELRKELGQGRVESDFSSEFPYTAIQKPTL